jgi:hypothetical protein
MSHFICSHSQFPDNTGWKHARARLLARTYRPIAYGVRRRTRVVDVDFDLA